MEPTDPTTGQYQQNDDVQTLGVLTEALDHLCHLTGLNDARDDVAQAVKIVARRVRSREEWRRDSGSYDAPVSS